MENIKINIYYANICDLDLSKSKETSKKRQQKIDDYIFDIDKKRCLGAWLLLSKIPNINLKKAQFKYNEYGKPYFENYNVYFNVSHSGEYVICAWGKREIGCDIQIIEPVNFNLVKYCMQQEEIREICNNDNSTLAQSTSQDCQKYIDLNKFFRYWTIKESYIKALGSGLSINPKKINVHDVKNIYEFNVNKNYCSALCLKGNTLLDFDVTIKEINL